MLIPANMVAWFSELVWNIYHSSDERSLCDVLVRSLSKHFHPLSDVLKVCCTMGLAHEIGDVFGPTSSARRSTRPYLSARDQVIIDEVRRHTVARLLSLRAPSALRRGRPTFKVTLPAGDLPDRTPAKVRQLLIQYYPRERREITARRLPDEIRRWLRLSAADAGKPTTVRTPAALRIEGPRGLLILRMLPTGSRSDVILHVTEERRQPDVFALQALGLTPRHCEVVHWLMAGKRDREIAAILGCSTRTIAGYIATMLRKTGANNRQAAVHALGEWLRTRGSARSRPDSRKRC